MRGTRRQEGWKGSELRIQNLVPTMLSLRAFETFEQKRKTSSRREGLRLGREACPLVQVCRRRVQGRRGWPGHHTECHCAHQPWMWHFSGRLRGPARPSTWPHSHQVRVGLGREEKQVDTVQYYHLCDLRPASFGHSLVTAAGHPVGGNEGGVCL